MPTQPSVIPLSTSDAPHAVSGRHDDVPSQAISPAGAVCLPAELAELAEAAGPVVTARAFVVPEGSWDTHAHVIGPFSKYPLQKNRNYTPPESLESQYVAHLAALNLQRGVIVQPSIYGTDNRLTIDVVRKSEGVLRGVVVLGPDVDEAAIAEMHAAGVRGFRLNLLFQGGPGLALLERTAAITQAFGWHAQLLIDIRMLEEIESRLNKLPVPVVFDHMGHFPHELGTQWPGFRMLLRRLAAGRSYVKLSGSYRLSAQPTHIEDVCAIAQTLVHEAPERLFWGSDWPHVGLPGELPPTADLLDALGQWCPDSATRKKILVSNPTDFYD